MRVMMNGKSEKATERTCPHCHSSAIYHYGMTPAGKQRLRCILCGHQFTPERTRMEVSNRPSCPLCEKPMHLYRRTGQVWRFRCSGYPGCHTYYKQERSMER